MRSDHWALKLKKALRGRSGRWLTRALKSKGVVLSHATVARWLQHGAVPPSGLLYLRVLADVLDVPVVYFFEGRPPVHWADTPAYRHLDPENPPDRPIYVGSHSRPGTPSTQAEEDLEGAEGDGQDSDTGQ